MKKSSSFAEEVVDGIVYIFDLQNDTIIELDEVSMLIWLLVETNTIDEIVEKLYDIYEVDIFVLKSDINRIIREFIDIGILLE